MIFKNIKTCVVLISLIFAPSTILHAETTMTLVDQTGTALDVFGYHSYQDFFNPDCSRMVTCSCNKVIVWDTGIGKEIITFDCDHNAIIKSGVFSPDGKLIFIVVEERLDEITKVVATVHDACTGEIVSTLKDFNGANGTFSPDATRIMGVGVNDNVVVWDAQTGSPLYTLDAKHVCSFSPNGKFIINAARSENDTKVFAATTGKLIQIIYNSHCYGFSQDGNRILVLQKPVHDIRLPECMVISLESNPESIEDLTHCFKISTDYSLIPGSALNPAKFAFRINDEQGYVILRDKQTGEEKILSLVPDSVPVPNKRVFHICSIEA